MYRGRSCIILGIIQTRSIQLRKYSRHLGTANLVRGLIYPSFWGLSHTMPKGSKGIWKWIFQSVNASNVLHPHDCGEIWQRNSHRSSWICVFKKILDRKITWLSLGHTKAESLRFSFYDGLVRTWRDVTLHRRNEAAFSNFSGEVKTGTYTSLKSFKHFTQMCMLLDSYKNAVYWRVAEWWCAFSIKLWKQEVLNRPQIISVTSLV